MAARRFPPGWTEDDEEQYQEARGESGGRIASRAQVMKSRAASAARQDTWDGWFRSLPDGTQLHYNNGGGEFKAAIKSGPDAMQTVALLGPWREDEISSHRRNPTYPYQKPTRFGGLGTIVEHASYSYKHRPEDAEIVYVNRTGIIGTSWTQRRASELKVGDRIRYTVPSGTYVGTIVSIRHEVVRNESILDIETSGVPDHAARGGYSPDSMVEVEGGGTGLSLADAELLRRTWPDEWMRLLASAPLDELRWRVERAHGAGYTAATPAAPTGPATVLGDIAAVFIETVDAFKRSHGDTRKANAQHLLNAIQAHPSLALNIAPAVLEQVKQASAGDRAQELARVSRTDGLYARRKGSPPSPVQSVEDAARRWNEYRDRVGRETGENGVSEIGNGVEVVDRDGKVVARVSYNGSIKLPGDKYFDDVAERDRPEAVRQSPARPACSTCAHPPKGQGSLFDPAPSLKSGDAPAPGRGSASTKGTPTDLNMMVLSEYFGPNDRIPNQMEATAAPHLRRCLKAGLLVPEGRTALVLTKAGQDALAVWRSSNPDWREAWERHSKRMGSL